jgi:2-hydroxychromene-2-carboxylate isomerase
MPITIDYYLSLNSPWTYIGSAPFGEIARRHGVTVNVKPAKFGPIFEQTGGLPLPKRSPQRRAYRMMELKRWREVRGLPLNLEPKHFPCDDAAATRLVISAKLQGKDAHRLWVELGRAVWEREESLADHGIRGRARRPRCGGVARKRACRCRTRRAVSAVHRGGPRRRRVRCPELRAAIG